MWDDFAMSSKTVAGQIPEFHNGARQQYPPQKFTLLVKDEPNCQISFDWIFQSLLFLSLAKLKIVKGACFPWSVCVLYISAVLLFVMYNWHTAAHIRRRDPRALRARSRCSSGSSITTLGSSIPEITERVTKPTKASKAARHDFDAQECHIDYLKQTGTFEN